MGSMTLNESLSKIRIDRHNSVHTNSVHTLMQASIQAALGVPVVKQYERYLGLPSFIGRKKKDSFDNIKQRVWKKLQGWEGKLLSQAGREILIKAVAQALPTYTISCFKLPVTLCYEIEALIRRFFWGQRGDSRKVHWVRWEELCKPKEQGGMGFKDLSRFNDALLTKQTWRLVHDKSSLFYRIFKTRFFPNCSIMEATCPSSASYAWKSIIKGRDVIKRGAIWRIGDGKSVHIWGDRWLPQTNSAAVLSPRVGGLAEARVQSLIDEERRCRKTELIDETLLDFEATMVKSIPLCLIEQPDELIWPHSANGVYTVKSGYRFLQTEFQNQQPGQSDPLMLKPMWKGIWSLNVPSKVKNLVWRAVKNSLPTKLNLVKRKVLTDDCCDHCKMQQEDTIHALYLCPKLEEIWLSVQAWNQPSLRQATSFVDLMGCILAENRDPDLFAMIIWAVWKRRNEMRVGKRGENLPSLVQQARTRLQDFLLHNSAATASKGQPPTQWQPPAHQQYNINFDGALFKDENQAGLGVVIRDSRGQVMVSLAQRIPLPSTAIEVEALAARRAMELALETGLNKGVLEGDSLILMNALKSNSHSLAQFGHLINDIQYLASQFPIISFSHVRRHCNNVAHSIARRAISFSSLQVWMEDVPLEIADVLQADFHSLS